MDPLTSLLESLVKMLQHEAHPPRMSWLMPMLHPIHSAQPPLHPSKSLQSAQPQLQPSKTLHSAQPALHPSWSSHDTTSAPIGNEATNEVADDADGEESSLSPASPEIVQRPRWDNLWKSYGLNHNLTQGERCAPGWFVSTRSRHHSTHEDRRDFRAARATTRNKTPSRPS